MGKILIVDLSKEQITGENFVLSKTSPYGRGLAIELVKKYDEGDSPLVLVPGLLTGNRVPCATRGIIMLGEKSQRSLKVSNFTGDMPQKLASLNISALVIKGTSSRKNTVLKISEDEVKLENMPELENKTIPDLIEYIRTGMGTGCAIWGVGKAADMRLKIASVFTTYPEGEPRFSCPRNSFGSDIAAKGLRAVIVDTDKYFGGECFDGKALQMKGKQLAKIIVSDKICGGALPGLGSMTLLHLLKDGKQLPEVPKREKVAKPRDVKINTCCAPMCVIGCLNRHSFNTGDVYASPAESEVREAISVRFGEEAPLIAKELNQKGMDIGIDTVEFVNAAAMYMKAREIEPDISRLMDMIDEIGKGTETGRILGSGTAGISELYKDKTELGNMVTRAAISKETETKVRLDNFVYGAGEVDDMEMMYRQVFLLENLGICIFTAFAVLNNAESLNLLAETVSEKLGEQVDVRELLDYSAKCMNEELEYQLKMTALSVNRNVPEFTKVLYKFFAV